MSVNLWRVSSTAVLVESSASPSSSAPTATSTNRRWVGRVLLVYLVSRVVSTSWYLVAAFIAAPGSVGDGRADLLTLLTSWDADWYQQILSPGYPAVLPEVDGHVQPNPWAFMPLFPMVVRAFAFGWAPAFPLVAVLVATGFGALAALALFSLVRRPASDRAAMVAVALFVLGPAAAVLQAGYSESMGLFLLFSLLALVDRHRYWAALAVAFPLAFTRPGMQAVAMVVGLHLVLRLVHPVRGDRWFRVRLAWTPEGFPMPARIAGAVLLIATLVLGFAWLVVAGLVTGRPDAYLATETSWRATMAGITDLHVFRSWPYVAQRVLGQWPGRAVVVVLVLALGALVLTPQARRLGPLVRLWFVSWWCYLLAVFYPQSSTLRLLLPVAPIGGVLGGLRRGPLAVVLVLCVLAQGVLVLNSYALPIAAYSPP